MGRPIRIVIAVESALCRRHVREALASDTCAANVAVVGQASNGAIAQRWMDELHPDLLVLDSQLPQLNVAGLLAETRHPDRPAAVIVLSPSDQQAIDPLTRQFGAVAVVRKPPRQQTTDDFAGFREALANAVTAYASQLGPLAEAPGPGAQAPRFDQRNSAEPGTVVAASGQTSPLEVVAIGVSTGGPVGLLQVLPKLPADFPVPVIVVQHLPASFTDSLASDLDRACLLSVQISHDRQPIVPGNIYLAPGDRQLKVDRFRDRYFLRVNDDPAERNCRPAVDYLFRSLAVTYGEHALAVVMTGMGDDGTRGARQLKQVGGYVIAQDEASCVVYGMPRSIVQANLADEICPLEGLADRIVDLVAARRSTCR